MATFPDPNSLRVIEPECERCPTLVACRTEISWGNGPADADVMVIGEAPAAGNPDAERWQGGNLTGLAYTSRHSGRIIRTMFAEIGVDPYYTNAVKCFPADGSGSNRPPTDEELSTCRDHLRAEIEAVEPGVIVTTGKHATETVLAFESASDDGFLETVLEPKWCESLGVTLVPVLHPSYQNVWMNRLEYDRDEYVTALGEAIKEEVSESNAAGSG